MICTAPRTDLTGAVRERGKFCHPSNPYQGRLYCSTPVGLRQDHWFLTRLWPCRQYMFTEDFTPYLQLSKVQAYRNSLSHFSLSTNLHSRCVRVLRDQQSFLPWHVFQYRSRRVADDESIGERGPRVTEELGDSRRARSS